MQIGIIVGRIGGIDGVALEIEKWIHVLQKMGHCIHLLAGQCQKDFPNLSIVPELNFHHPLIIREQNDAFFKQNVEEDILVGRIESVSEKIEREILHWLVKSKIDLMISENSSALPCHLALGLAIKNVIQTTGMKLLAHDHDFSWEREDRYKSKYKFVNKIMNDCFPIKSSEIKHAVINKAAKSSLKKKFDLDSVVVPNVMDFDSPYAQVDDYNHDIRQALNLDKNDIPIIQVTRIVRRKGIEVAIKIVREMDDSNIKLIITGGEADDHNSEYYGELVDLVNELNLTEQVLFSAALFKEERWTGQHIVSDLSPEKLKKIHYSRKIYSLSDAYSLAHICSYFSTYEGFGNAFVEALLAKKPIWVNNYKPVYWSDIGNLGFKTVMLKNYIPHCPFLVL